MITVMLDSNEICCTVYYKQFYCGYLISPSGFAFCIVDLISIILFVDDLFSERQSSHYFFHAVITQYETKLIMQTPNF